MHREKKPANLLNEKYSNFLSVKYLRPFMNKLPSFHRLRNLTQVMTMPGFPLLSG